MNLSVNGVIDPLVRACKRISVVLSYIPLRAIFSRFKIPVKVNVAIDEGNGWNECWTLNKDEIGVTPKSLL